MKILLTGTTGYIGKRLLLALLEKGHIVVCMVRDSRRFNRSIVPEQFQSGIQIVQADLLDPASLINLPTDIEAAYYLVHSMGSGKTDFYEAEAASATNFVTWLNTSGAKQLIYLSGIVNAGHLSKHLASRKNVEEILKTATAAFTILRASIIIGSGSASFEIIRDLVEKLPVMITPKWLNSRCQPIAIRDVLFYLTAVLNNASCYNKGFDIGGPDVLTYKEMLLKQAKVRGLKRFILTLPILTPKLSSYWLYFVTSTSFRISRSLVNSLKNDTIVQDNSIQQIIPHTCLPFEEALKLALGRIEQNTVISSWTDSLISGSIRPDYMDFIQIPEHGVFTDKQEIKLSYSPDDVMQNIWSIGGRRGWYKTDWLWEIRGLLDKFFGGVGLRRGRRHPTDLQPGDTLDFWRVLLADKQNRRLLLYAEMKLPGEAWLQFRILDKPDGQYLEQLAAFRPQGLLGRLYWFAVLPFHFIIFKGMIKNLASFKNTAKPT